MRMLDMKGMRIIHQGGDWPYEGKDPCTREMLPFLERNESIISWVQPTSCKGLCGQIPVIRVNGCFCSLSLRMMKSVWRHVRLKKEFVNMERLPQGGLKLRIPDILLLEKIRTQTRFNTMRMKSDQRVRQSSVSTMTKTVSTDNGKHLESMVKSKEPSLMCKRVVTALEEVIFPLVDRMQDDQSSATTTTFSFTDDDYLVGFIRKINLECPALLKDRETFLENVGRAFDSVAA